MKYIFVFICLLTTIQLVTGQTITLVEQSKPTSIRGLSVVDDHTAWVSGSKGHVGLSTNGGQTWAWQQVKGFEQSDFRDIEAFSDKEAIIMSSGTPAVILKTVDGGVNWKEVYRQDDKAYFLDAMAFYNKKHGIALGDPINGRFVLLKTINQGKTWTELHTGPNAKNEEAAFAASGTSVFIAGKNAHAILLTGGSVSRLHYGNKKLKEWNPVNIPLAQGQPSKGGFSLAAGGGQTVLVGGNYSKNNNTDSVACYYNGESINGISFHLSKSMPAGYQSCVAYLQGSIFLSTGTPGSNITTDGGQNWKQIDTTSYNVCQKAKKGNLVILAGDKGKIALFTL